jgi:signal transduction histidine kinase
MDTRTLIFSIGLLNLSFALLAWLHLSNTTMQNADLALWQRAKFVCGLGYLLGWARPMLPEVLMPWAHIGNALQFIGIALELGAYLGFLGLQRWRRTVAAGLGTGLIAFTLAVVLDQTSHAMIISGTSIAGLLYASMALIFWQHRHRAPQLMTTMALFDALVASLLLYKAMTGLLLVTMVPYAATLINSALYVTAFVVMCCNGFGFLLLIKQGDDLRLRSALAELTKADAQQRQFIAMLSHEVRSPLAVIDATAQVLEQRLQSSVALLPLVARVRRGAVRLAYFFENSITQDRIDTGNFSLEVCEIDISKMAHWAKESAEQLSTNHTIELVMPSEPFPVLMGDPTLLRMLLSNLLANALKYSAGNTIVTLRLSIIGNCCRMEVIDQGAGIPLKEQAMIFKKYARGAAAEHVSGAGLGLALVKHIADLHRGSVHLESQPGAGARFIVDIPMRQPETPNPTT